MPEFGLYKMGMSKIIIVALVGIASLEIAIANQESPPLASKIQSAYASAQNSSFSVEYTVKRTSPLLSKPLESSFTAEFTVSDNEIILTRSKILGKGTLLRHDFHFRDGELLHTSTHVNTQAPKKPTTRLGLILESTKLGKPSATPTFESVIQNCKANAYLGLVGGKRLWQLFEGDIANLPNSSFETDSDYGRVEVQLSESNDWLPIRIQITQSSGDLHYGAMLESIKMAGGKGWPTGGINSCNLDVQAKKFGIANGHPYVREWIAKETFVCDNDVIVEETTEAKITHVDYEPPEELKIPLSIPMWHPATVEGAEQLSYVWDGNWVVPAVGSIQPDGLLAKGRVYLYFVLAVVAVAGVLAAMIRKR